MSRVYSSHHFQTISQTLIFRFFSLFYRLTDRYMDTFTIVQNKPIEEREALKQLERFIRREETSRSAESQSGTENTNINETVMEQIRTIRTNLQTSQSK